MTRLAACAVLLLAGCAEREAPSFDASRSWRLDATLPCTEATLLIASGTPSRCDLAVFDAATRTRAAVATLSGACDQLAARWNRSGTVGVLERRSRPDYSQPDVLVIEPGRLRQVIVQDGWLSDGAGIDSGEAVMLLRRPESSRTRGPRWLRLLQNDLQCEPARAADWALRDGRFTRIASREAETCRVLELQSPLADRFATEARGVGAGTRMHEEGVAAATKDAPQRWPVPGGTMLRYLDEDGSFAVAFIDSAGNQHGDTHAEPNEMSYEHRGGFVLAIDSTRSQLYEIRTGEELLDAGNAVASFIPCP